MTKNDKPYKLMYFEYVYGCSIRPIGTCSHILSFDDITSAVNFAKRIKREQMTGEGLYRNTASDIHVYKGDYILGPCEVFEWNKVNEDGSVPSHINPARELNDNTTHGALYW